MSSPSPLPGRIDVDPARRRRRWLCGFLIASLSFLPPQSVALADVDIPDDFETGLQAAHAFADHFGLVEEDSLVTRVNDIAYRVASQTGRDDIAWSFHVLDVDDPNAFALPGGFLFVTRGILDTGISDSALAHLMGHEMAHVTQRHFARADRTSSLLSLLQTAAVVATILAIQNDGARDPVLDSNRRVDWGTDRSGDALTNTMIFGSVFRELLVRGYGRGLEMEADEVGRRFAVRAGYPIEGGAELLERLHERIYEDQEYGYWRTHPFFTDRVAKARTARSGAREAPSVEEVEAYRLEVSQTLAGIAEHFEEEYSRRAREHEDDESGPHPGGRGPRRGVERGGPEPTVLFLYRAALEANPQTASSLQIEAQLLGRRAEWERRKREVHRSFGPLAADYDSLVARIDGTRERRPVAVNVSNLGGGLDSFESFAQRVESERDLLRSELEEMRPGSVAIVEQPGAGLEFLELFLRNYPDDPLAPALRVRLAEQYRLADRADEAALLLTEATDDSRAERDHALARVLPQVKELSTLETLLRRRGPDSLATRAEAELRTRASTLDSLEIGSRYLEQFPRGSVADTVAAKVEDLAMQRYYGGRLHESLETYQAALDAYHRVIFLAPRTRAARLAREGIERVHTLRGK